jgi:hypothetical protein
MSIMKLFRNQSGKQRVGATIEIGSGSIAVAVIVSDPHVPHPEIVWAKREFAVLSAEYDFARSIKSMLTTLMNTMMALDSEGRSALQAAYGNAGIDTLQVSISAPWAYTISKIVEYESEAPFVITDSLIATLVEKANEETLAVLRESEKENNSGLTIMTRATTDITGNGYHTLTPVGQTASTITLTQVSAVAQNLMTAAVDDLRGRMFPRAALERYSTMLLFHSTIRGMYPEMTEYCLVDLTYEATELAIIRDGVLQYTTHTHVGINTLVRNLALRLDTPEADAASVLKRAYDADTLDTLSAKERTTVEALLGEYQAALEELFHETGDSLSIPKVLFLHSSYQHERFFDDYISAAAKAATSSSHTVHTLSHELMLTRYTGNSKVDLIKRNIDTGVLMAAQFFHKQVDRDDFTQA